MERVPIVGTNWVAAAVVVLAEPVGGAGPVDQIGRGPNPFVRRGRPNGLAAAHAFEFTTTGERQVGRRVSAPKGSDPTNSPLDYFVGKSSFAKMTE